VILSLKTWYRAVLVILCVAFSCSRASDVKDADEVSDREDRAKMIRRIIEAANVPIEFWGKVTDQDGVPLEGVKVAYTCLILWGNDVGVARVPKELKGQAVSDASGSFAITGLGGQLGVSLRISANVLDLMTAAGPESTNASQSAS
jgi:hypothetical protein